MVGEKAPKAAGPTMTNGKLPESANRNTWRNDGLGSGRGLLDRGKTLTGDKARALP
jgi:hypothetical protein